MSDTGGIVQQTLSSGLAVVCVPMSQTASAVAELTTAVGSRHDPPNLGGITHFLEHMLYRGTPTYPGPHELALCFERFGGMLEAATAVDSGSLALSIPPENLELTLPALCEVFQAPLLHGLDVERSIVKEEILESLDDDGTLIDPSDVARRLCFGEHPLGRPITGSVEALARFDEPILRAHHRQSYVGSRAVLTLAGSFPVERILQLAERSFADLPRGERAVVEPPPPQHEPRFKAVRYTGSQTSVNLTFRAPGMHDALEPATELLLGILDDGMSTRLYHRICNTLGLCYEVGAYYEAWDDLGVLEITAESAHERTGVLIAELLELLVRLRDEGATPEELATAKQRSRWQMRELVEDPGELASYYGSATLFGTAHPAERVAELDSVSPDQLRTAAEQVLAGSNLSAACVGQLPRRSIDAIEQRILSFR